MLCVHARACSVRLCGANALSARRRLELSFMRAGGGVTSFALSRRLQRFFLQHKHSAKLITSRIFFTFLNFIAVCNPTTFIE